MVEKDDIAKQKIQEKITEKLSKLNQSSAKAYREQLKALNNNNTALETFQHLLEDINTRIEDQYQGFSGLLEQIKGINKELGNENKHVNDATKAFRGLESIASRLKDDQKGYTDLNIKQLKQEKSKLKSLEDQAKEAAKQIAIDKGIVDLANTNLSDVQDLSDEQRAILTAAQENFSVYKRTNELLKERIEEENKINKKLGVTGVLLTGMSKIPLVGPLLETNDALDAAKSKAKAGGNEFQVMGAAIGSMGKSLATSLTSPLGVIGLIVKGFQMLLELGFATDKQVVALQKSLYLSRDGAEALRKTFHSIAENNTVLVDGLNSAFVSVTNQNEAMMQLSDAMGGVSMATLKEIQNQILLTKQMGFTVEEGQALYVLGRQNKMTASEIVTEIESQVKAYQKQSGVLLNAKKITSEVSTINGQLRLQYKNNVTQLTAAVIQSNKLGFSLKQSKDIAEGLLNFEQSIENELSAELLLGRGLNLEQARLLALNGESAKATALIAENMGGSAGFAALNVVQQDALAKALNMNADELANSMLYQENLLQLGDEDKQRVIEQIDLLESKGNIEAAQQLQRAVSAGTDIDAALKAANAQDLFYANIEKIKNSLQSIVEGPAMKLARGLAEMAGSGEGLYRTVGGIAIILGGMKLGGLIASFVSMATAATLTAAASAAVASAITLGVGLIAVVAGIALIMNGMSSASDKAQADIEKNTQKKRLGGSVSGFGTGDIIPALLEPKEYVIPNSPGKTGTEKYHEMVNSNKTKGTNSSNNQDFSSMIAVLEGLRSDFKAQASRPITTSIQVDCKELILAQSKFKNVQGDANRIDDFEMS